MAVEDKDSILLRVNKELHERIKTEARNLGISKTGYLVLLIQKQLPPKKAG